MTEKHKPFTMQLANGKTQSFESGETLCLWYEKETHTEIKNKSRNKDEAADMKVKQLFNKVVNERN